MISCCNFSLVGGHVISISLHPLLLYVISLCFKRKDLNLNIWGIISNKNHLLEFGGFMFSLPY